MKNMNLREILNLKKQGKDVAKSIVDFFENSALDEIPELEYNACVPGGISYDYDLEVLLEVLSIKTIVFNGCKKLESFCKSNPELFEVENYYFISDNETSVIVPIVLKPNRHGDDLSNEEFLLFNKIVEVPNYVLNEIA